MITTKFLATVCLTLGCWSLCADAASLSRSTKDVEEYAKFLRDSVDGLPEEPLTPELATLQNEEERSGKFQGDIILTEEQQAEMVAEFAGLRNGVRDEKRRWSHNVLYYNITTKDYTAEQIKAIEEAIEEVNSASCLEFKKRDSSSIKNYVQIKSEKKSSCSSNVGMVGGEQRLNLTPAKVGSGCFRHGTIMHELLHAAGFHHEHSTYNRDDYIEIIWDKIKPGKEKNYNKYSQADVTNFGQDYDYGSILHYSEYGNSLDGHRTMKPRHSTTEKIGQREKLSEIDIKKLNKMYNCPKRETTV